MEKIIVYLVIGLVVLYTITLILRRILESKAPKDELWIRRGESQSTLVELLSKAKNKIDIVTGKLYPAFYESAEVIKILRSLLESKGTVRIVFSKFAKDMKEALKKLQKENPRLFKLLRKHKELKLYWGKKRAIFHYAVVDGTHLFLVYPDYPGYELFYKSPAVGKTCQEGFEEYVGLCSEVKG